jgi:hypothetical protein
MRAFEEQCGGSPKPDSIFIVLSGLSADCFQDTVEIGHCREEQTIFDAMIIPGDRNSK